MIFFIDSSVLIEYNKGNKIRLFSELLANDIFKCYINETVVSEFLFHFLAHNGEKSPLSIHSAGRISEVFANSRQYKLINMCRYLPTNNELFQMVLQFMSQYNLLPNDAHHFSNL